MTNTALDTDPKAVQRARAARLRELTEPWSLRKLEARTGVNRSAWQLRLNGDTALSISDIEVLAPLIRMTPSELFEDLMSIHADKPHTGGATGRRRNIYLLDASTADGMGGALFANDVYPSSLASVTDISGRKIA